ncbi:AIR synthase family protein [Thermomicrobium sp. 4228-Ro]|uniref:AIR synthase family protein n=1 Tax=Thermomicrobium sp. 4228-Ro TaxID=2993937 RepID=UPI002249872E|nr:AIR synthase family protein [Thermomicrobium sp. 4228-Ro]MCX2726270.1 AIR synthase family protein [Thermomicrobium sp. 4228-Ro]
MPEQRLHIGKLPADLLASFLGRIALDDTVVLGPGIGRDAAVVRVGERLVALKSDPITFATDAIGWYAVNVNANDIACLGAIPRWFLATVLLPETATVELAQRVLDDLAHAASSLGIALVGGHTEITASLDRPIVSGTMVGVFEREHVLRPELARPGDAILLVRGIAIEGTALLARECARTLERALGPELLARCQAFLTDPGISVLGPAKLLYEQLGPALRYLHDPTEGGLATGLHELATACGTGIRVRQQAILVYPETEAVCRVLALDPLGLIASGALLAVVAPSVVEEALRVLAESGIPATQLGWLDPDPDCRILLTETGAQPLPTFVVDEVARLFADGGCT